MFSTPNTPANVNIRAKNSSISRGPNPLTGPKSYPYGLPVNIYLTSTAYCGILIKLKPRQKIPGGNLKRYPKNTEMKVYWKS